VKVSVSDECLWLKHIPESELKRALASVHSGSRISLSVDGAPVILERMQQGKNSNPTTGFRPVGNARDAWRSIYLTSKGHMIDLDFAGSADD
jgi:hypothetical protein